MDNIKDIVAKVVHDMAIRQPQSQDVIQRAWEHTFNANDMQHTRILDFKKGQLTILVDSPARGYELRARKSKILQSLQKEAPDISEIRFLVGKIK